jgi:hypothetical protein
MKQNVRIIAAAIGTALFFSACISNGPRRNHDAMSGATKQSEQPAAPGSAAPHP